MSTTGLDSARLITTTAAGVHAVPLAEFALAGALHFAKGFPELRKWQQRHHWQRYTSTLLANRTVTIVGMGSIGREVARVFRAMRANTIEITRGSTIAEALPVTDILILCCPLTAETENLIGAAQLAELPARAILINLARGKVVDEQALMTALANRKLAGACLDVFHTEPLPRDSPLWDMDNVIVSPHSASTVATENAAITELFVDNLSRYRAGTPLRNQYDPQRGY
ncbi:MAG TPA: D-2-hydroxyacid dehydrogenase [Pseudonocardiaceae bacterium]|jgi:phosphoglycerate dehydrogenase-like enzyme|nr:D-2-hydroxyacid dehydrogenase [Pseudonocardiaceae bacterium]